MNYRQLVQMHQDYRDNRNFEILAFPCNQFGSQEPDKEDIIEQKIIKSKGGKYDVEFPMMSKIEVMNKRAHPLYLWLRKNSSLQGGDMTWNFEKFLINGNGNIVGHYSWDTEPDLIRPDIEKLIGKP